MSEEIHRWRSTDQASLRRFTEALEAEYRRRLDDWVQADSDRIARLQGAALVFREFLEFFKYILAK